MLSLKSSGRSEPSERQRPSRAWALSAALLVPMCLLFLLAAAPKAKTDSDLPKKYQRSPFSLMSLSVGSPHNGWQLRAKRLRNTPHLRVRGKSSNLNYGHPALVLMLRRSAKDVAAAAPGSRLLVGDLSRKQGGPLAGHRSHQSGRDADIGFFATNSKGKPVESKRFVAFDGEGRAKDGSGLLFDDHRNWLLLQAWARDRRAGLSHVFVSTPLKRRLLAYARKHARYRKHIELAMGLLKQPDDAAIHDDHFHVRIECPKRHDGLCRN